MNQHNSSSKKMMAHDFARAFQKLNSEELLNTNKVLVAILKEKQRGEEATLIWDFQVGQKVRMKPHHQSRAPYDAIGTIKKINRTKLSVQFDSGPGWNIPPTMLDRVEETSDHHKAPQKSESGK